MLESLALGDDLRAGDVVLDVVVEEVVAVLVADAAGPEGATPLVTADLEDAVGVAGRVAWAGLLLRVHVAVVLHDADVVADEGATNTGAHELLGALALRQDASRSVRGEQTCERRQQQEARRVRGHPENELWVNRCGRLCAILSVRVGICVRTTLLVFLIYFLFFFF